MLITYCKTGEIFTDQIKHINRKPLVWVSGDISIGRGLSALNLQKGTQGL